MTKGADNVQRTNYMYTVGSAVRLHIGQGAGS